MVMSPNSVTTGMDTPDPQKALTQKIRIQWIRAENDDTIFITLDREDSAVGKVLP